MFLSPRLDAVAVVHAVIRVFQRQRQRQLQSLVELSGVHQRPQKSRGGVPQQLHRAERPEDPLVPPIEKARRCSPRGNPRSLVTIRHHGLRLAQRGGITSQHRHHVVRTHRPFGQSGGLRLVRSVVIKHFAQRQLLVQFANEDSAFFINLLDRQLNPFFLVLPRLGLSSCQRQHHADGNILGSSRRIARRARCPEPPRQQSPRAQYQRRLPPHTLSSPAL